MAGPEQKERQAERPSPVREQLRREMRDSLAFYESPEDSLAYGHAAEAIKVLVARGLDAADSVEKELRRQDALEDGDKRKMPPEERRKYEDMLTQVETWAISLPEMLRQARVVQSHPQVRERLWDIFRLVSEREKFMQELQDMRFIVLKGSDRNPGSPFESAVPKEFYELAAIATTGWIVREQIHIHPELLSNDRKAERTLFLQNVELLGDTEVEGGWIVGDDEAGPLDAFLLKKTGARFIRNKEPDVERRRDALIELFKQGRVKVNGEPAPQDTPKRALKAGDTVTLLTTFARKTERVQTGVEEARIETDETRKVQNAERGTQNFPGVEQLAYNPLGVMAVWKRLLESGGQSEQKRYARQLRGDLEEFDTDFLQKGALEEFRKNALDIKEDMVNKNERAKQFVKFWLWLSGKTVSETVAERLTTNKEEFDQIFEETMKKMEGEFDQLGSPQNKATLSELQDLLGRMEAGQQVDRARLNTLIDAYTAMHRTIGGTLVRLQSWQVRENMDRVGGAQKPNNLDLVARSDNKSTFERLRSLAPFGAFQRLSYIDPEGRVILVEPDKMTPGGMALDSGKLIAETAATSVVLSHVLTRIPYLSRIPGFKRLMGRVAVPVVLAEGSIALSDEMARQVRVRIAGQQIEEAILALEALSKNEKRFSQAQQIQLGIPLTQKIRSEMTVLLHAATKQSPEAPRIDLLIEAHLYTNDILTAFGLPPLSKLNEGIVPKDADALQKKLAVDGFKDVNISPEVQRYMDMLAAEKALMRDRKMEEIRYQRGTLLEAIQEKQEDPLDALAQGRIPATIRLDQEGKNKLLKNMMQTRDSGAFEKRALPRAREALGTTEQERIRSSFAIAGDVFLMHRKFMKMEGDLTQELGHPPGPRDVIPLNREFTFGKNLSRGTTFTYYQLVHGEVHGMLTKHTPAEVIAAARYIRDNPPTDKDLAEMWLHDDGYSDNQITREFFARWFDPPAARAGLGEKLLNQWIELYAFVEQQRDTIAYDATKEVNLGRLQMEGSRLFKLPGQYWMVVKPEIMEGKSTGALLIELGENSGKGDGSYSRHGSVVFGGDTYPISKQQPAARIDAALLGRDAKITINGADGKPLVKNVPLLHETVR